MVSNDKIEDEIMEIKEEIRRMNASTKKTKFCWRPFGIELVLPPSWNPIDEKQAKEVLRNPKRKRKK
ncbi:hypothetical protein HN865_01530 [Candidatus Woesearchaeota archaeon]|nr:hypothetical protein [Candidatus Woesearchaeota archaeon]MBT7237518.1 hypothetical protein [Candidatus Woesearchaeota archaeon]